MKWKPSVRRRRRKKTSCWIQETIEHISDSVLHQTVQKMWQRKQSLLKPRFCTLSFCCFTVVIHGNKVQQAVLSYRVNSRAFPEQQPEPIIARSQNYYKVNTHHKMRTKCHIHSPPSEGWVLFAQRPNDMLTFIKIGCSN